MAPFIKYQEKENKVTTGILSLDNLLDLTTGTLTCIYESPESFVHNTILQTFISSCLHNSDRLFVLSTEEKTLKSFEYREDPFEETQSNLKIAWRYKESKNDLDAKKDRFKWNLLKSVNIQEEVILRDIDHLFEVLKKEKDLKIAIFSLFAPLYGNYTHDRIFETLFQIKKHARIGNHTIFLSIPTFLLKEPISVFFDNILSVKSNVLFPHETSLYNSYLEIIKSSSTTSLKVNQLESYKYGIVIRPKKIRIEKIDIPPEEFTGEASSCAKSF